LKYQTELPLSCESDSLPDVLSVVICCP